MCLFKSVFVAVGRRIAKLLQRKRRNTNRKQRRNASTKPVAVSGHVSASAPGPAQSLGSHSPKGPAREERTEQPLHACRQQQADSQSQRSDSYLSKQNVSFALGRRSVSLWSGLDLRSAVAPRRSASYSSFFPSVNCNQTKRVKRVSPIPVVSSTAPCPGTRAVNGPSVVTEASSVVHDSKPSRKPERSEIVPATRAAYTYSGVCGLQNLGNTCYMNAVIQVLRCIPELNTSIRFICGKSILKKDSILMRYGELVDEMRRASLTSPARLQQAFQTRYPSFCRYEEVYDYHMLLKSFGTLGALYSIDGTPFSQQDASEFMRLLVSEMHEEWKSINPQLPPPSIPPQALVLRDQSESERVRVSWVALLLAERTDFAACFMGMLRSSMQCQVCLTVGLKYEPFWDITVHCPQRADPKSVMRLETCLDLFTKKETLDQDERPTCDKCGTRTTSVKQLTLQKMPHVMAIVVNRCSEWNTTTKHDTLLSIPLSLDMDKYLTAPGFVKARYCLFAIINHSGSQQSGHFTTWCRTSALNWHLFNDSQVSLMPPAEGLPRVLSRDAYIIFYSALEPPNQQ